MELNDVFRNKFSIDLKRCKKHFVYNRKNIEQEKQIYPFLKTLYTILFNN